MSHPNRYSILHCICMLGIATQLCMASAWAAAPASLPECRETLRQEATVVRTRLNGVPAILRLPREISKPPIILLHGFGPPQSEDALMQALPLDEVAAIKVYVGLPLFGERTPARGTQEIIERQSRDMPAEIFEPVVLGAAKELAMVRRALVSQGCASPSQAIGLFGFSAGGAAALYALAERDVAVAAAVTLNASTGLSASLQAMELATGRPYRPTPQSRALAQRSDATTRARDIAAGAPPPALLIIHGDADRMLPASLAESLYAALRPYYAQDGNESRLRVQIEAGLAHNWAASPEAPALRAAIAAFFNSQL